MTASTTDAELQAAFDHAYPDEKPGSRRVWLAIVRRFVRDAGDQYARLVDLTASDCTTRNKRKAAELAQRMVDFQARVATLREQEELDAIRPDLDGRQVMDHLGIGPGRHVGEALAHLLEVRLEEGPLGPDEAYAQLDAWWADQPR